jgi:hypothetical protein
MQDIRLAGRGAFYDVADITGLSPYVHTNGWTVSKNRMETLIMRIDIETVS